MSFQQLHENRKEEYLAAKRAAVEAVEIGQETLAESARQGEQLSNSEKLADQTQFALDKSARILRGMTWSGWFANLTSKNISEEDYFTKREQGSAATAMLRQYDNVPEEAQEAAQAIQNYYCNLQVFMTCETDEQRKTCRIICDNMYQKASTEISKLQATESEKTRDLLKQFLTDMSRLRERQKAYQRDTQSKSPGLTSSPKKVSVASASPKSPEDVIISEQDEHLDFLSKNLDDMHSIAHSLHESVSQQTKIIDSLDEKSDVITDKTRMVTRRTDRLIQKKVRA